MRSFAAYPDSGFKLTGFLFVHGPTIGRFKATPKGAELGKDRMPVWTHFGSDRLGPTRNATSLATELYCVVHKDWHRGLPVEQRLPTWRHQMTEIQQAGQ